MISDKKVRNLSGRGCDTSKLYRFDLVGFFECVLCEYV